jgi:hypothetical protein
VYDGSVRNKRIWIFFMYRRERKYKNYELQGSEACV